MDQPEGRRVRRPRPDFTVDRKGRARAGKARRSPLWTFALIGSAGVALTSPQLAVGEALFASGRAAAQGGEILLASARAAVQSAADLIRSRSPGVRSAAHLIKIKHARPRPVARAKPRLRAPAVPPAFTPPAALPLAFADTPIVPAWQPVSAFPVGPIAKTPTCLCNFGYIPPVFGGGGVIIGGGGGGPHPPPPPPPPPGVPEPDSWGMMILGFAVIGTAWRRRRAILAAILRIPLLSYTSRRLLGYAPHR